MWAGRVSEVFLEEADSAGPDLLAGLREMRRRTSSWSHRAAPPQVRGERVPGRCRCSVLPSWGGLELAA